MGNGNTCTFVLSVRHGVGIQGDADCRLFDFICGMFLSLVFIVVLHC